MKPARYRHRKDVTSHALIAEAKRLGARYLPLDGAIDGLLEKDTRYWLVDFKSPGATLTAAQAKLVASGWKIEFLSTVDQVQALLGAPIVAPRGQPRRVWEGGMEEW